MACNVRTSRRTSSADGADGSADGDGEGEGEGGGEGAAIGNSVPLFRATDVLPLGRRLGFGLHSPWARFVSVSAYVSVSVKSTRDVD